RSMRHERGMIYQALHASKTFRERKKMRVLEKPPRPFEIRLQHDGDHAAESSHLFLRESVLRMFLQAGITHGLDFGFCFEPARDLHRVLAMPLHPQREGLQAAQREKTIEWSGNRTDRILQKRDLIAELLVISHDDHSAHHVGVAV